MVGIRPGSIPRAVNTIRPAASSTRSRSPKVQGPSVTRPIIAPPASNR